MGWGSVIGTGLLCRGSRSRRSISIRTSRRWSRMIGRYRYDIRRTRPCRVRRHPGRRRIDLILFYECLHHAVELLGARSAAGALLPPAARSLPVVVNRSAFRAALLGAEIRPDVGLLHHRQTWLVRERLGQCTRNPFIVAMHGSGPALQHQGRHRSLDPAHRPVHHRGRRHIAGARLDAAELRRSSE